MLNKSEILKKLIQEYDVKTTRDVQEMLKDLFAETIQEMLEAELDEHLGYDRYDIQNKNTTNSRNGHRSKKVRSDFGEVDRKSTRLNSSHVSISYAVFCLKKKKNK